MESLLIWFAVIIFVLIIFVPYALKILRAQKKDVALKKEAEFLGADKPVAQYPQIDYFRCIGCGACVEACPEGSVLGIVSGKATIINGLKCVGHGLCAEACPVNGIAVGLGDIKTRPDIPVLNEYNETNIPGLFIAGELAGLALIKNAISQGRLVTNSIAEQRRKISGNGTDDLAIIGAGPAGLTSALTAIQNGLSFSLIDQQGAGGTILQYPRKKLVMTKPVEIPLWGWLKKPEYSKEELLDIWQEVSLKNQVKVHTGQKLNMVKRTDGHFEITTQDTTYQSKYVILALGRRGTPRKLGVPGEDRSKVMYKLMEAEAYQNNHMLIVGGGDSAVEAAIGLAHQSGNIVTISYRKPKFFRIKTRNEERIQELINKQKIRTLFNSNVIQISDQSIDLEQDGNSISLQNDFVFVFAGGEPPFQLMQKIGIALGGELTDDN